MTVMLTSIVVYIYTVVAFNFFRKFYNKGEDGETDYKCHDMLTVCILPKIIDLPLIFFFILFSHQIFIKQK